MAPVLTSPLVSTQWLADHLGADELVVVDASVHTAGTGGATTWRAGRDAYEHDGHVPGSVFADLVDDFSAPSTGLPFTRPDADRFERGIRALGVATGSTVVVYDDDVGQWAARLWWIFRSFGFDAVAVLDGGFTKWRDEGRPVRVGPLASRPTVPDAGVFLSGGERPLWADRARVLRAVDGTEPATLVLATDESALGAGHAPLVPGSTEIAARRVIDAGSNAYLRPKALAEVFAPVLDADEIVTYCGVGSAACVDALALTMLGHDHVRVYDGSLTEWWRDDAREPVAS